MCKMHLQLLKGPKLSSEAKSLRISTFKPRSSTKAKFARHSSQVAVSPSFLKLCSEAEQSIFYSEFTSSFLSCLHTQQASTKPHARSERSSPEELSIFHKSLSRESLINDAENFKFCLRQCLAHHSSCPLCRGLRASR